MEEHPPRFTPVMTERVMSQKQILNRYFKEEKKEATAIKFTQKWKDYVVDRKQKRMSEFIGKHGEQMDKLPLKSGMVIISPRS